MFEAEGLVDKTDNKWHLQATMMPSKAERRAYIDLFLESHSLKAENVYNIYISQARMKTWSFT